MARIALADNNRKAVEVLKTIQEKGGIRRLDEDGYSWYMMKRFRDRGLVELKETEKTAKKGKNPSLYTVTGKGRSLIAASKRWKDPVAKEVKPKKQKEQA